MSRLPQLDDCEYYTDTTDSGKFVGRVRQFPALRTRPQDRAMDATDDIVTLTRNKLIQLNNESERLGDGTWPVSGMGGQR